MHVVAIRVGSVGVIPLEMDQKSAHLVKPLTSGLGYSEQVNMATSAFEISGCKHTSGQHWTLQNTGGRLHSDTFFPAEYPNELKAYGRGSTQLWYLEVGQHRCALCH